MSQQQQAFSKQPSEVPAIKVYRSSKEVPQHSFFANGGHIPNMLGCCYSFDDEQRLTDQSDSRKP